MGEAGGAHRLLRCLGDAAAVAHHQRRREVAVVAGQRRFDAPADRVAQMRQRHGQADAERRRSDVGRLRGAIDEADGADALIERDAGEVVAARHDRPARRLQPRAHRHGVANRQCVAMAADGHAHQHRRGRRRDPGDLVHAHEDADAAPRRFLALRNPATDRDRHLAGQDRRTDHVSPHLGGKRAAGDATGDDENAKGDGAEARPPRRHGQDRRERHQRRRPGLGRQAEIDQDSDAEGDRQPQEAAPGVDLALKGGGGSKPRRAKPPEERPSGPAPRTATVGAPAGCRRAIANAVWRLVRHPPRPWAMLAQRTAAVRPRNSDRVFDATSPFPPIASADRPWKCAASANQN